MGRRHDFSKMFSHLDVAKAGQHSCILDEEIGVDIACNVGDSRGEEEKIVLDLESL